jgi:hypothetical protein
MRYKDTLHRSQTKDFNSLSVVSNISVNVIFVFKIFIYFQFINFCTWCRNRKLYGFINFMMQEFFFRLTVWRFVGLLHFLSILMKSWENFLVIKRSFGSKEKTKWGFNWLLCELIGMSLDSRSIVLGSQFNVFLIVEYSKVLEEKLAW